MIFPMKTFPEIMSTFSNVTDPLVASQRVFCAEILEDDLNNYKLNQNIEDIFKNLDENVTYDGWEVEP